MRYGNAPPHNFYGGVYSNNKIMPLHTGKGRSVATALGKSTDYVENPEKTDDGEWNFSYECDPMMAD